MPCCMCEEYEWEDPQEVVYTDPEDGKEYCLFHAPVEHKGVSVDEFNAKVVERVQAACNLEDGKRICSMVGTVFPGDIAFDDGQVFPGIDFSRARFSGDVSFQGAIFPGNISFDSAKFSLLANFSQAKFESIAEFSRSRFLGVGNFEKATFEDRANFESSTLREGYFHRSTFKKEVHFIGARFDGDGNFKNTSIGGQAFFDSSNFGGEVCFKKSKFSETASFNYVQFSDMCEFEYAVFNDYGSFVKTLFMKGASFNGAYFNKGVGFYHAKFSERAFFVETNFDRETVFDASEFHAGGDFSGAKFNFMVNFAQANLNTLTLFRRTLFKYGCSFKKIKFNGKIRIDTARSEGPILFKDIQVESNAKIEIENMTLLSGITFQNFDPVCLDLTQQRDFANIHFVNASWDKNGHIETCTEDEPGKLQLTRDFYQRMKAKYKAENNEYEASKWHIAEKEAQLKLLGGAIQPLRELVRQVADSGGVKALWKALTRQPDKTFFSAFERCLKPLSNAVAERLTFRALWLYKYSSGYGERPARALFWLGVLVGISVLFPGDMRGYIPLMKQVTPPEALAKASLFQSFGRIGWQLLISIQAALFAFALRNNFRR
ncbi:MAG: pentapeptide repeat-containing protein [Pseudodesulfovibrio sp.]|uniref:pentapeptide repeat-containing protein n=1 Tax=Pseudodesulfovibrio sp. TaxID=2035812 RepID=UPI003D109E1D